MLSLTKTEWKFLGIVWVAVIVLTFLPLIIGYFATPSDSMFLFRPNVNGGDFTVYDSYIEQVKSGKFLFNDFFTSEQQPVGFLNVFWLLVGLFARVFFIPTILTLQVVRFIFIPLFLLSAYLIISFFFDDELKKKLCFIFFIFASGWGWTIAIDAGKHQWRILDLFAPESFTFTTLYSSPHFIASLLLIILIFFFSIKYFLSNTLKYSFFAGISAFLLFWFHPYHVYTIFGVLLAFIIIDSLVNKKISWNYVGHLFIVGLFSLPPILYQLWTIVNIPIVHDHFLQNITLTPPLLVVLISYGFLIPLALVGVVSIIKEKKTGKKELFLIVWFFTQFLLLYLPVKTQIRLAEGLYFPVSILLVHGIFYLKQYLPSSMSFGTLANKDYFYKTAVYICIGYAFIILFCISTLNTMYTDTVLYLHHDSLFYITKSEYQAIQWLKNTQADSVILSSEDTGNVIPAFVVRHVFIGHSHETANFTVKHQATEDFFKKDDAGERLSFLKENNINYVFFGLMEKMGTDFDPNQDKFLQKVYENGEVTIYKVI